MLIQAARIFPEQKDLYLDAARKAGECTWRFGLLLKGDGLCHGITGNAYALHSLYRGLKLLGLNAEAEQWRARAWTFATATLENAALKEAVSSYHCKARKMVGVSDHPFCLMEGIAGNICLYSELLADEDSARFPGYEVTM